MSEYPRDKILARWTQTQGVTLEQARQLHQALGSELSPGQLSQFLLPLFELQSQKNSPDQLFFHWLSHRLSQPSEVCPLTLKEAELSLLKRAKSLGFEPIDLAPVAPLGVASTYQKISQGRIVSALKNAEVVSDPSNVFALILTQRWKQKQAGLRVCATHRVLRPAIRHARQLPHFVMFALAELVPSKDPHLLAKALMYQLDLFLALYQNVRIRVQGYPGDTRILDSFKTLMFQRVPSDLIYLEETPSKNAYYLGCRLLIESWQQEQWVNVCDLGIVDWPAKLSGQGYLRLVISGLGIERYLATQSHLNEK